MAIRYAKIAEIEDKVTESAENLNFITDLIKIGETTKVIQTKKSVYAIVCTVLGKYVEQGLINRTRFLELFYAYHKEDENKIEQLRSRDEYLVCEKFVIFALFLFDGVTNTKELFMDSNKVLVYFKTLFGLAKVLNLQITDAPSSKLDKYYLSLILNKFILLKTYSPLLTELITDNYLLGHVDLAMFSVDYLSEAIKGPHVNSAVMLNVVAIMTNLELTLKEMFEAGCFFSGTTPAADLPSFEQAFKKSMFIGAIMG